MECVASVRLACPPPRLVGAVPPSQTEMFAVPDGEDELVENAAAAVREMLVKNKFLSRLILRDNRLTAESLEGISDALKGTRHQHSHPFGRVWHRVGCMHWREAS